MASAEVWVHLVRHGQVDNPGGVFYGRLPGFGLHENGKRQAAAAGRLLAERIQEAGVLLCASPMQRAQETAQRVASELGLPAEAIRTLESINEVQTCGHEGRPIAELAAGGWNIYEPASGSEGQPGETFEGVAARVRDAVRALARELAGTGREVIAVSHGDCVASARLWALGLPVTQEEKMSQAYPEYCSVTSLRVDGAGNVVEHNFSGVPQDA